MGDTHPDTTILNLNDCRIILQVSDKLLVGDLNLDSLLDDVVVYLDLIRHQDATVIVFSV